MRTLAGITNLLFLAAAAFGQSADPALQFEAADIHASAKAPNAFFRTGPVRAGRYEVKNATMLDLIRIAYGFDPDKVLGGPSWLGMDRFDVIAKVPDDSTPDTQKQMLQTLLRDRFKLVVRKETKPLPTYALVQGKTPHLKKAEGTEEAGCRPQSGSGAPAEGGIRLMTSNANGTATTISLGPGMVIQYQCRNMTMAAFASGLRSMMGASLGTNPVLDQTGLEGAWNFDVKWSMQIIGPMMSDPGDRISTSDAIEKQLGLKLEQRQVPTPVIVVDTVNQQPSPNAPDLAMVLPLIPIPTEFEVADVKPTDPEARMGRFQIQPGGRLVSQGMALRFLVSRAFNTFNNDEIVGLPKWADSERFDITAKAPAGAPISNADMDLLAPMVRALLADRFKMTYHTEERPVAAYSLVSAKPKMKKADPASRASCTGGPAPAGAPPGSRSLACQNITMEQFADRLQNIAPGLSWPILNSTALEGGWDFQLIFSMGMPMRIGAVPGRGGDAGAPGSPLPSASDPSGGYTIFEAIEKQLGLKLESQKRSMPVIVIDHIEQKPTEN